MCSHKASVGFYIEGQYYCKASINHTIEFLSSPWDLKLVIIMFQDRLSNIPGQQLGHKSQRKVIQK